MSRNLLEGTRFGTLLVGSALVLLLLIAPAKAKPPTLNVVFPPGAVRGQSLEVKVSGNLDHWPAKMWVEGRGVLFQAEKEKGKFKVFVAGDCDPGPRWIRLFDEEGATDLRPFVIGILPEIQEVEPNDELQTAQRLNTTSTTINGRLARAGDVDTFRIDLTRGQKLVADIDAVRHLGSPMDAVLQIVSPQGSVLAQNDDDSGHDPRIIFDAPSSGPYLVRLFGFPATPDSSIRFAGGNNFVYRLTLTVNGFVDYAFPLAISSTDHRPVQAIGWNINAKSDSLFVVGHAPNGTFLVSHPSLAATSEVREVPFETLVESEPNDLAKPQKIPSQVALSGRIDSPGDRDVFRLSLRKGDVRSFRIEAHTLGRPLDPTLRVLDASGKFLVDADDGNDGSWDLERTFTAPDDGDYRLVVRDLNGRGGPRFAYLLSVVELKPDFALSLTSDRFDLTPGKPTKVTIVVERKNNNTDPIEIVPENLPTGVTAKPSFSKSGEASARSVTLELTAEKGAVSGPFRVIGMAAKDRRISHLSTHAVSGIKTNAEWLWVTLHPRTDVGN